MMVQEIQQWLSGPGDYAEGRVLFEKYSKNASLKNLFRRKYKPEVLRYNLAKIKPLNKPIEPDSMPQQERREAPRKSIISDRIAVDDLPENIRLLYEQNKELYKHMRSYHEKMKCATGDEDRAKYRQMVSEYDDQIAANWDQIDHWDGSNSESAAEEPDVERTIAAARKYLSVNVRYIALREGLKQQKLIFSIQERIALLQKHGVKIPKSTLTELKKFGIHYGI